MVNPEGWDSVEGGVIWTPPQGVEIGQNFA